MSENVTLTTRGRDRPINKQNIQNTTTNMTCTKYWPRPAH